ncbi:MAG: Ger(x)C family spore germination protein [Bacillota bacterium]|nr:Ger(x)C family spore germination protein [Bacillota bacterium]
MKRFAYVLVSFMLVFMLSGCYDSREIERTGAVIAMGIDKGDLMKYRVSFHIQKHTAQSSGGSDKGGELPKNQALMTVEAPTVADALRQANEIISVDLNVSTNKMIIISEDIAKEGMYGPLYEIISSPQLNYNSYIAVAKGKAMDVMKNVNPAEENYLSVYYELILYNLHEDHTKYFFSDDVYFNLESYVKQDVVLPLVGVNNNDITGYFRDDTSSDLLAGEVPRKSTNKAEFLGGAVFKGDKMIGYLTESEMAAYSMLYGTFRTRDFTVEYPKGSGKYVVINLNQEEKPAIKTTIENGKIKENFDLKLTGVYELKDPSKHFTEFNEAYTEYFKSEIKRMCLDLLNKSSREWHSDIFSTGKRLRKCFTTWHEYEDYNYMSKFPETEYSVNVEVRFRRNGRFS